MNNELMRFKEHPRPYFPGQTIKRRQYKPVIIGFNPDAPGDQGMHIQGRIMFKRQVIYRQ
jgi:hypothetical protein